MTIRREVIKTYFRSQMDLRKTYEMGMSFGYPQCCVFEFVDDCNNGMAPAASRGLTGNQSGFVPCAFHSRLVDEGKMTLTDLIDKDKRDEVHGDFKEIWD